MTIPIARGAAQSGAAADRFARIARIVVIYEENHSFDNLYGSWEGVNGLASAPPARTIQVNQAGVPFTCLDQNDPDTEVAAAHLRGYDNWGPVPEPLLQRTVHD